MEFGGRQAPRTAETRKWSSRLLGTHFVPLMRVASAQQAVACSLPAPPAMYSYSLLGSWHAHGRIKVKGKRREGASLRMEGGREERKSNYCIIDAPHNSHSRGGTSKTCRTCLSIRLLSLRYRRMEHAVALLFEVCHASLSEISRQ